MLLVVLSLLFYGGVGGVGAVGVVLVRVAGVVVAVGEIVVVRVVGVVFGIGVAVVVFLLLWLLVFVLWLL